MTAEGEIVTTVSVKEELTVTAAAEGVVWVTNVVALSVTEAQ